MESLVAWYQSTMGDFVPKEVFVFFVSMLPLIELRGGIVIASLLKIPLLKANIICIIGNVLPIPFVLLFIKRIFKFMKDHNIFKGLVEKLEQRAEKKSSGAEKGEFAFLLAFVGIPLPGTGAWTGTLAASILDMDFKSSVIAVMLGVVLAGIIMGIVSMGLFGAIFAL